MVFPILQETESPAALHKAPNINFAKEVYDLRLMRNTVDAIFIAPKLHRIPGDPPGIPGGGVAW